MDNSRKDDNACREEEPNVGGPLFEFKEIDDSYYQSGVDTLGTVLRRGKGGLRSVHDDYFEEAENMRGSGLRAVHVELKFGHHPTIYEEHYRDLMRLCDEYEGSGIMLDHCNKRSVGYSGVFGRQSSDWLQLPI